MTIFISESLSDEEEISCTSVSSGMNYTCEGRPAIDR